MTTVTSHIKPYQDRIRRIRIDYHNLNSTIIRLRIIELGHETSCS